MGLCVSAEIVYFLYLWKCSGQLHTINIVLKVRLEDLIHLTDVEAADDLIKVALLESCNNGIKSRGQ